MQESIQARKKDVEARKAAEKAKSYLLEERDKAQQEASSANQQVWAKWFVSHIEVSCNHFISVLLTWTVFLFHALYIFIIMASMSLQQVALLLDINKQLQEYNTSLQHYNNKLQSDAHTVADTISRMKKEK